MCSETLTICDRYYQQLTLDPYEPMVAENAPEAKVRLAMAIPSSNYNANPITVSSRVHSQGTWYQLTAARHIEGLLQS